MRKIILAGLLTAAAACAQAISVGVIAGAPLTNVETTTTLGGISYLPKSPNFTVGPTFQLNLPLHLRVEFDALIRPADFRASNLVANTNATEWRFPLLVQYRLGSGKFLQPFVGVGASFEHLYQIKNAAVAGPGSIATNSPGGMVIDGGIDFKVKLARISAELRYTRQFNAAIFDVQQLNQAEVLVGARF
jgi:outer membrane protein W